MYQRRSLTVLHLQAAAVILLLVSAGALLAPAGCRVWGGSRAWAGREQEARGHTAPVEQAGVWLSHRLPRQLSQQPGPHLIILPSCLQRRQPSKLAGQATLLSFLSASTRAAGRRTAGARRGASDWSAGPPFSRQGSTSAPFYGPIALHSTRFTTLRHLPEAAQAAAAG